MQALLEVVRAMHQVPSPSTKLCSRTFRPSHIMGAVIWLEDDRRIEVLQEMGLSLPHYSRLPAAEYEVAMCEARIN